ncbi:MAG: hypothetical protein AAF517_23185, partial [Planctomycetota bacterium]
PWTIDTDESSFLDSWKGHRLLVANFIDLHDEGSSPHSIEISASEGIGLDRLRDAIRSEFLVREAGEFDAVRPCAFRSAQIEALKNALAGLSAASDARSLDGVSELLINGLRASWPDSPQNADVRR